MRRFFIAAAAAVIAAPAAAQQRIDFILNWVPGGDHGLRLLAAARRCTPSRPR